MDKLNLSLLIIPFFFNNYYYYSIDFVFVMMGFCVDFSTLSFLQVSKREGDSSLMQLKEEFRTYEALRREHDAQIVQIATEAGLRIAPDQWSSLLYGDTAHKSHMQSIIDKLQTPQSFGQSVQVGVHVFVCG